VSEKIVQIRRRLGVYQPDPPELLTLDELVWYLLQAIADGASDARDWPPKLQSSPGESRSPHPYSGVLADVDRIWRAALREIRKVVPSDAWEEAERRVEIAQGGFRTNPAKEAEIENALRRHLETGGHPGPYACRAAVRSAGIRARNDVIDNIRRHLGRFHDARIGAR
jgi:hypothetical protein